MAKKGGNGSGFVTGPGQIQPMGKDRLFIETEGGVILSPEGFGGPGITGEPKPPAMRGAPNAPGDGIIPRGSEPRKNSILDSFFMERK